MLVVPGTKVAVKFYTFPKKFPPLYYDANEKTTLTMASINAGNSERPAVGLGGVNQQFLSDLNAAGQKNAYLGPGQDDYEDRHRKLMTKAGSGGVASETYQNTDPSAFSYVQTAQVNTRSGWFEGVCFLDVFSPKLCPEANPLNAAMLYAAPPYGDNYPGEPEFVAAIQATAVNIIKTVAGYNAVALKQNLPVIQALRNTLYSSSLYNRTPKVSPEKIARAIFAGFQSELQAGDAGLVELQFPVGTGSQDRLFGPVQDDLTQTAAPVPAVGLQKPPVQKPTYEKPTFEKLALKKRPFANMVEGDEDQPGTELQPMQNQAAANQNLPNLVLGGNNGQNVQQQIQNEQDHVDNNLQQNGQGPGNYGIFQAVPPAGYEPTDAMLGNPEDAAQAVADAAAADAAAAAAHAGADAAAAAAADAAAAAADGAAAFAADAAADAAAAEAARKADQAALRKIIGNVLKGVGTSLGLAGALIWAFVFGGGRKVVTSGIAKFETKDVAWPANDLDPTVDVDILLLNDNPVLIDTVEFISPAPAGSGTWAVNPVNNHAIFTPAVRTNQSVTVQYVLDAKAIPGTAAQTDPHTLTVNFSPTPTIGITPAKAKDRTNPVTVDVPSEYANFAGTIKLIDDQGKQVGNLPQTGVGTWTVTPTNQVTFMPDGGLTGTEAKAPYVRLTAWGTPSNEEKITLTFPAATTPPVKPPTATVTFVKTDTTTLGDWVPQYGADGYAIAGDAPAKNPSYVAPGIPTQSPTVFSGVTNTDPRALVRASNPANRVAAAWSASAPIVIDLPFSDSAVHQVAIYFDDYDSKAGSQTVEVLDANGKVLDTRPISSFSGGLYLVWNISGQARIRITNSAAGNNAIVSGVFFGGGKTIAPTGPLAAFVMSDARSQGNWKNVYGADGYAIAGDQTKNPSYVTPAISPQAPFVYAPSTTDVRALQKGLTPTDRVAAAWYANSTAPTPAAVVIDLPFTDSAVHQVAIYCIDWDTTIRRQTVEALDASGKVLNTQTLSSSFNGGVYLVWNVRGHVQIRIRNSAGMNGVVSGVFFDPATKTAPSARFVKSDTTKQGNWQNTYGADGYAMASDQTKNPSYVTPAVSGPAPYVFAASTTDVRALQKGLNPADRVAAAWYTDLTAPVPAIVIDLPFTDSALHQVAIYCLDFDRMGRGQTVEVLDTSGNVLNTQTLSSFGGGVYLVWDVAGHVQIRIIHTAGMNGVVSGVFFDRASTVGAFAVFSRVPEAYDFTLWITDIPPDVRLDFMKHCVIPGGFKRIEFTDGTSDITVPKQGRWSFEVGGPPLVEDVLFQPVAGLPLNQPYSIKYSVVDQTDAKSNQATMTVNYSVIPWLMPKAANFLLPSDATAGKLVAADVLKDSSAYYTKDPKSVVLVGLQNVQQGTPTAKALVRQDGKAMRVPGEGMWMVDDNGLVAFQAESKLAHPPTPALFRFSDLKKNPSNAAVIMIDPVLDEIAKVGPDLGKQTDADFWKNFRKCVIDDPLAETPSVDLTPEQFITVTQTLAVAARTLGAVGPNPVSASDFDTGYKKWAGGAWGDLLDTCAAITSKAVSSSAPKYAARYWQLSLMVRMAIKLMGPQS